MTLTLPLRSREKSRTLHNARLFPVVGMTTGRTIPPPRLVCRFGDQWENALREMLHGSQGQRPNVPMLPKKTATKKFVAAETIWIDTTMCERNYSFVPVLVSFLPQTSVIVRPLQSQSSSLSLKPAPLADPWLPVALAFEIEPKL